MSSFYDKAIRVLKPVMKYYHRMKVEGIEHVPAEGQPFVLAANHPSWFGWDAMAINCALDGREVKWVSWSYPDEYPGWDKMVEKFGGILYHPSTGFPYEQIARDVLGNGGAVGFFPEGNNNAIAHWYRLRPFFPGCIRLAAMAGVPVIPVGIAGVEESSPIFSAQENDGEPISHLKVLPVVLPTTIRIAFGEPFTVPPEILDGGSDALKRSANDLQDRVLDLFRRYRPRAYARKWPV